MIPRLFANGRAEPRKSATARIGGPAVGFPQRVQQEYYGSEVFFFDREKEILLRPRKERRRESGREYLPYLHDSRCGAGAEPPTTTTTTTKG